MRYLQKKVCRIMALLLLTAMLTPSVIAAYDLTTAEPELEVELISSEPAPVSEAPAPEPEEAAAPAEEPADSAALVEIIIDGKARDTEHLSFVLDGVTYAPLRDVCTALGAEEITFDAETRKVGVSAPGLEITLPLDEPFMVANGRYLYVENGFTIIDGSTMVPIRTLCTAFGADISWDAEDAAVHITSGGTPILSGDEFYDEDEVYWMTRIIHAEAGVEPFIGKIAVGDVIMNRVESDEFPDSVYDVIFDRRFGVQFTPTADGSIYKEPDDYGCDIAAKIALEGTDVIDDALYFATSTISCWASRNRPYLTEIGTHAFYL